MGRRKKCRCIQGLPQATVFKPRGVPLAGLEEVVLPMEGLEALRLADLEQLSQEAAAARMGVSRSTFCRILALARQDVARSLVRGAALRIDGGHYAVAEPLNHSQAPNKDKEIVMTKVAVRSDGPTLQDMVDPRFGRAGGFVVVDVETMETSYLDNGASQAMAHGAGIQAAQRIVDAGAGVLLTGHVGPKAFDALSRAGIAIGVDLGGLTVREAVERYKAGTVTMTGQPNN